MVARRDMTPERFWARVDRSGGPDACWPWRKGAREYGEVVVSGRFVGAHRFAYRVNPAHLFVGTPKDNGADRSAKKRTRNGTALNTDRPDPRPPMKTIRWGPDEAALLEAARAAIDGGASLGDADVVRVALAALPDASAAAQRRAIAKVATLGTRAKR